MLLWLCVLAGTYETAYLEKPDDVQSAHIRRFLVSNYTD
jgi:hypothetical protein